MVHCLKIDLGAPVAAADPYIHLDSFVAYAAGVESIGHDGLAELEDDDGPFYFEEEMPFRQYERDGEWVWATTAAGIATNDAADIEEPERWSVTKWRKHFDDDPVHQIKETHINTSSGSFKSYNAALPYSATDTLQFFFEGDPERVRELIKDHIAAIGKKRSQGFGRIRDVQVTSADGYVDSAIYHDGHTLRSFPEAFTTRVAVGVHHERRTVRPPYWHQANQTMAIPPFVEVPRDALVDDITPREVAHA